MRKLMLLALFFCTASAAMGAVSTRVRLAVSKTPIECEEAETDSGCTVICPDIMVNTKLTIVVDSNDPNYWSGSLLIEDANRNYGILSARKDAALLDAGVGAVVFPVEEIRDGKHVKGFDLYTGFFGIEAGDWFIIDYEATNIGYCNVGFYQHVFDDDGFLIGSDLVYYLEFSHVRTRDFNGDTVVDFCDLATLAAHWQQADCNEPDWCEGTDLCPDPNCIPDGIVDNKDLALFADYWLERTQ